MKRILVACEYSGRVRDAFRKLGHDAWSCDLLPAETPSPYHYQCDLREVLDKGWDMLIAFPDCTFVCGSGIHWNDRGRGWERTEAAVEFFRMLWEQPIPYIALENPIGILSKRICKPTQIIQPHQFGDDASKATCLWLKNLPSLSLPPSTSLLASSGGRSGGPTRPTAGRTVSGLLTTAGKSGHEPTKESPTRWPINGTSTSPSK
jgi:hypothetical protein